MALREYLLEPIQAPDGRYRRVHRFVCCKCGKTHQIGASDNGLPMTRDFLEKKLRAGGWEIGKTKEYDICPDCVMKARKEKRERKHMNANAANANVVQVEPEHREPSREDKRIIIAELESVYVDEKTGYSGLWSDQRVAEKLCVPRKWVSDVREDLFGPEGSSEGAKELLSEAKAIRDGYSDLARKAQEAHAAHMDEARKLSEREAAFSRRFAEMQKAMG